MELFLYGNPRLLAGGLGSSQNSRENYEYDPLVLQSKGHSTADLERVHSICHNSTVSSIAVAKAAGEVIHHGKGGYHSNIARNIFLVDGQWPSAGVELETIASSYTRDHAANLVEDLHSNWFHFERDGSLDENHSGEFGFELITDPLPPRVYRDPRTWIGLENILSPWLESFDHSETGLHVHVGLNQFMNFDLPVKNKQSRMFIGKVMCMLVYYSIADAAFIDRVCLRKQTRFCRTPGERNLFDGAARLTSGEMTGYEFIDMAIGKLLVQNSSDWAYSVRKACDNIGNNGFTPAFCNGVINGTTSHGTEVNTEHKYTIEFRRAKGTLHSLSIHRIVELMTMIVRYAGKCCRNPSERVSSKAFYEFVHDNTTSVPLQKLIEKAVAAR